MTVKGGKEERKNVFVAVMNLKRLKVQKCRLLRRNKDINLSLFTLIYIGLNAKHIYRFIFFFQFIFSHLRMYS